MGKAHGRVRDMAEPHGLVEGHTCMGKAKEVAHGCVCHKAWTHKRVQGRVKTRLKIFKCTQAGESHTGV